MTRQEMSGNGPPIGGSLLITRKLLLRLARLIHKGPRMVIKKSFEEGPGGVPRKLAKVLACFIEGKQGREQCLITMAFDVRKIFKCGI